MVRETIKHQRVELCHQIKEFHYVKVEKVEISQRFVVDDGELLLRGQPRYRWGWAGRGGRGRRRRGGWWGSCVSPSLKQSSAFWLPLFRGLLHLHWTASFWKGAASVGVLCLYDKSACFFLKLVKSHSLHDNLVSVPLLCLTKCVTFFFCKNLTGHVWHKNFSLPWFMCFLRFRSHAVENLHRVQEKFLDMCFLMAASCSIVNPHVGHLSWHVHL